MKKLDESTKGLYNFLDKHEGREEGESVRNIEEQLKRCAMEEIGLPDDEIENMLDAEAGY